MTVINTIQAKVLLHALFLKQSFQHFQNEWRNYDRGDRSEGGIICNAVERKTERKQNSQHHPTWYPAINVKTVEYRH